LDEAARVDGATHLQVLWHVLLPLLKPPLIILVVFNFLDVWNDYLGPLIYLNKRDMYTLALGLTFFQTRIGNLLNYLMAISVLMLIPPTLIYFFAQRHIIGGIASVGLKG
jgi:multiple sugar transport system permease protein